MYILKINGEVFYDESKEKIKKLHKKEYSKICRHNKKMDEYENYIATLMTFRISLTTIH